VTRVYVDVSLFTPNSAVGVINGHMDVADIPTEGGTVAFDKPVAPTSLPGIVEFQSRLTVERVSPPVPGTREVMLSLADITVATRADALKVAKYLEEGFGLHFNEH
jgi:hypothetical protein